MSDDLRGAYNTKKTMLKASLFDCNDAYILAKGIITVAGQGTDAAIAVNRSNKQIFKNCMSFTGCISEIDSTQVDNARDLDVLMPIYNVIEYSNN